MDARTHRPAIDAPVDIAVINSIYELLGFGTYAPARPLTVELWSDGSAVLLDDTLRVHYEASSPGALLLAALSPSVPEPLRRSKLSSPSITWTT